MYARVTSFKVDPSRLDEPPAKIEQIQPAAKALPGIVDNTLCGARMDKAC